MTPAELQDRIAALSGELNTINTRISEDKRQIAKLTSDCLTMFQAVTELRRKDDS